MFCAVDGHLSYALLYVCVCACALGCSGECPSLQPRFALGFMLATVIVFNALFAHRPPALLFVYAGPVLPYSTCTNNYAR